MIVVIIAIVILIIWLVAKNQESDHKEQVRQISGELRVKYPNFVKTIREVYNEKAKLYTDNNKSLCFKIPILTFNRHMGDIYYSLIDNSSIGNKPYIIQVYKGEDRVEINTERQYMLTDEDLEIEEYLKIFNDLSTEILSDSRYLESITY